MADNGDDEVYSGTVKKYTKDEKHIVIACPVVSEWYGVDARLSVDLAPADLDVGDAVRFSITETGQGAPVGTWIEKTKPKKAQLKEAEPKTAAKRKVEESNEPAEGEELYTGTVARQSKDGSSYFIDCECVKSWYGTAAKVSADLLFLAGAGTGDEILFTLVADAKPPRAAWAERANSASAKKRLRPDPVAATPATAAAAKPNGGAPQAAPAAVSGSKDELQRLKEQLAAETQAKLEAQLEAERTKAAAQKAELDRLQGRLSAPAAAAADDSESESPVPHPLSKEARTPVSKGKGKTTAAGKGPAKGAAKGKPAQAKVTGTLNFASPEDALSALALFGTELNGAQVQPELDPSDEAQVQVKGLNAGTTPAALKAHFEEAGQVVTCTVEGSKGAGKSSAEGAGKGVTKGKSAGNGATKGAATKGAKTGGKGAKKGAKK